MRKPLQTLWLPLSLLVLVLLPLKADAQNGWVKYYTGYNFGINDVYFVNNMTGWATGGKYIIKTTNGGQNWIRQADTNTIPQDFDFKKIFFYDSNTGWVAGGGSTPFPFCIENRLLFKTTNGGTTWVSQPAPSADDNSLYDIVALSPNIILTCDAGTDFTCIMSSGGVFRSSSGGSNWNYVTPGNISYGFQSITFIDQNTGWALGMKRSDVPPSFRTILKTSNSGLTWNPVYSDTLDEMGTFRNRVQFLNSNTGYLFFGKLLKSTNGGANWFNLDTALSSSFKSIYFMNTNTGWASSNNGNYRTTDGGNTWQNQPIQGGTNFLNQIFFKDELHGWVGSWNGYVYATGTGGVTGIQPISSEIPAQYVLHQNYPNPFNPVTQIRFEIPKQGNVNLKVYEVMGREVAELVNGELQPGVYEYEFNGTGLGSGVYFYKLNSGEFTETRRMVLVK